MEQITQSHAEPEQQLAVETAPAAAPQQAAPAPAETENAPTPESAAEETPTPIQEEAAAAESPKETPPPKTLITPPAAQPGAAPQQQPAAPAPTSYFDGNTLQLVGWRLLGFLLSVITFGLAAPWVDCMIYRWETKHTVVGGKRLYFDGRGHQLLGRNLLWNLLTVITFGIFLIFQPVGFRKWRAKHTRFATPEECAKVGKLTGWQIATVVFGVIAALAILAMMVVTVMNSGILTDLQPDRIIPDLVEDVQNFVSSIGQEQPDDSGFPGYGDGYYFFGEDGNIHFSGSEDGFFISGNEDGFYSPDFSVQIIPPEQNDLPLGTYYVTAVDGLNLREGNSTQSPHITTMPYRQTVEVFSWHDGWASVQYNGFWGYCSGEYLSVNDPGPLSSGQTGQSGSPDTNAGTPAPAPGTYTVAQVEQAIADANAIIESYRGKTTGQGRAAMSAAEVTGFFERAAGIADADMWFAGWFDTAYDYLQVTDGDMYMGYTYLQVEDDTFRTVEDMCDLYFSYFADDYAVNLLKGRLFMLDGKMYAHAMGYGVEAVYHSHRFEVAEENGSFLVTTIVTEYRDYAPGEEKFSEFSMTHRCIKEDGIWVWESTGTIYT